MLAKDSIVQATVETRHNTCQYARSSTGHMATQASRVTNHAATQHHPTTRDNQTETCYLQQRDSADTSVSGDSAIDVSCDPEESDREWADVCLQIEPECRNNCTQDEIPTSDRIVQADLPDPQLHPLQQTLHQLEKQQESLETLLSQFYIPVNYTESQPSIDTLRGFLNSLCAKEPTSRTIALYPSEEKPLEPGYLTAANNSPVSRRTSETLALDSFSSFGSGSEDSGTVEDELREKLDLAYKVGLTAEPLQTSHPGFNVPDFTYSLYYISRLCVTPAFFSSAILFISPPCYAILCTPACPQLSFLSKSNYKY